MYMDSLHMDSIIRKIRWNNLDGLNKFWGVKMAKQMDVEERKRLKKGLNGIKKIYKNW